MITCATTDMLKRKQLAATSGILVRSFKVAPLQLNNCHHRRQPKPGGLRPPTRISRTTSRRRPRARTTIALQNARRGLEICQCFVGSSAVRVALSDSTTTRPRHHPDYSAFLYSGTDWSWTVPYPGLLACAPSEGWPRWATLDCLLFSYPAGTPLNNLTTFTGLHSSGN
jgi:hypothetical protein